MGAVQKWVSGTVVVLSICGMAKLAGATDLTDADRTYGNFVRESATVDEHQVRVEVRGLSRSDSGNTRLDLVGRRAVIGSITGGIIEAVGSFGVWKGSEAGIIIPYLTQSTELQGNTQGEADNSDGLGDVSLYWKFKQQVAEHFNVGTGVEIQTPSNTNSKLGYDDAGINPFIGVRYSQGAYGIGINTGYQFYTGNVPNVYNFGGSLQFKGGENWALRTEVIGRVFDEAGWRNHDVSILPGVDYNISHNVVFRPTGIFGATSTALDWGLGAGLSATF